MCAAKNDKLSKKAQSMTKSTAPVSILFDNLGTCSSPSKHSFIGIHIDVEWRL